MNRIFKCFIERRCRLSKLFLCKIFETKSDGKQVGMKILYELNSIEHNCFYDPTTGKTYYTLLYANIAIDEHYCKVCDTLVNSASGSSLEDIYKRKYLTKEEIMKLNEIVSELYSIIRRGRYEVV